MNYLACFETEPYQTFPRLAAVALGFITLNNELLNVSKYINKNLLIPPNPFYYGERWYHIPWEDVIHFQVYDHATERLMIMLLGTLCLRWVGYICIEYDILPVAWDEMKTCQDKVVHFLGDYTTRFVKDNRINKALFIPFVKT